MQPFPMQSGRWYAPTVVKLNDESLTDENYLYALPIYVPNTISVSSVSVVVSETLPGTEARLGIYSDNGSGFPDALQAEADDVVDCSTSGGKEAPIDCELTPGWYWLACVVHGPAKFQSANHSEQTLALLGADTSGNAMMQSSAKAGIAAEFTYAPLPATFPTGGLAATIVGTPCPIMAMLVA